MTADLRLAEQAARWIHARAKVKTLRSARMLYCERAEPVTQEDLDDAAAEYQSDPLGDYVFPQPTQDQPCWKPTGADQDDRSTYLPRERWCQTCLKRQAIHDELVSARRHAAGVLRGLIRMVKTQDAKSTEPTV